MQCEKGLSSIPFNPSSHFISLLQKQQKQEDRSSRISPKNWVRQFSRCNGTFSPLSAAKKKRIVLMSSIIRSSSPEPRVHTWAGSFSAYMCVHIVPLQTKKTRNKKTKTKTNKRADHPQKCRWSTSIGAMVLAFSSTTKNKMYHNLKQFIPKNMVTEFLKVPVCTTLPFSRVLQKKKNILISRILSKKIKYSRIQQRSLQRWVLTWNSSNSRLTSLKIRYKRCRVTHHFFWVL